MAGGTYADMLGPRRASPGVRHAGTSTPQHRPLVGREAEMQRNAAGGYVFKLSDWDTLRRFLILGTTQGTYYASGEQLTNEAMALVKRCIAADPQRTVDIIVEISKAGSPLKQSPCLVALALACSTTTGDPKRDSHNADPVTRGRAYALAKAPEVLRTYSHVFEFLDYCRRQRGAGTGLLNMLSRIILDMPLSQLEYQTLKYRNRSGWTPRDLLRYSHAKTKDILVDNFLAWTVKPETEKARLAVMASAQLDAFETIQDIGRSDKPDFARAAKLIADHKLTHEFVPNTLQGDKRVWEALLHNLPLTALVRNLRKMTQVGLLVDGNRSALDVLRKRLVNAEYIRKSRLHPLRLMGALAAYTSGTDRRGGEFMASGAVIGIIEEALELSWSSIEPINKRVLLAVDKSGSMSSPSPMAGLSAFHACLALAAWYKRSEAECQLLLFDQTATPINVSNRVTFSELRRISNPAGGTDIGSPIKWALDKGYDPELSIVMTDNDTWSGRSHYVELMGKLRKRAKHPIASVVAAVTATSSTVNDPNDKHALEVVGYDPTVPEAISAHAKEVFQEK